MTDTSFFLNHWQNRFRRFIIEVHYLKNRTSQKDHVIQVKDPKKPLITLRTGIRSSTYNNEHERDMKKTNDFVNILNVIDSNTFGNFDGNEDIDTHYNKILEKISSQDPSVGSKLAVGLKDLLNSIRMKNDSDEDLQRLRNQCDCFCHKDNVSTIDENHNNHCVRFCVQGNEEEDLAIIERLISNQVINYIEPEVNEQTRRKYWLFGPKITIPIPKIYQKKKVKVTAMQRESNRVYNNIEIIAQSLSPPIEEEEKTFSPSSQMNAYIEPSSFSRKPFAKSRVISELNNREIDLKDCKCPICERRKRLSQGETEPWKVVMNDISLFAALVSTGSKPYLHSKSSLNIAGDFTNSKHYPELPLKQQIFCEKEVRDQIPSIENEENLIKLNDENEGLVKPTIFENKQNTQRSMKSFGALTIKSMLENTKRSLSGTYKQQSPSYDGVFQDYDYSDEEMENTDAKINIKSAVKDSKLNNVSISPTEKNENVISTNESAVTHLSKKNDKQEDVNNIGKLSKIQLLQQSYLANSTETKSLKVNPVKPLHSRFN